MAKKDAKAKAAEKKTRVAAKQTKKASKTEKKARTKGKADDSDAEDVDLEAVLEEYAKQQAQFLKVTEVPCDPPPPRASATVIGSPSTSNELFLFGGEYFNGALATFFNDLYVYFISKGEWRRVTSPNSPLPRSGHAWCRGGNAGGVYLFGGEFSSPKQGTFYHYNDFWRLEPGSREWARVETKGKGPPARSGHRMTYYKNYIIVFGGFQDTSQQTKYLSDIWLYDTHSYTWHAPVLPPASQKPDARSSFSLLPHDSGAVLYGGYSRVKTIAPTSNRAKGSSQGVRAVVKPMVHQDTWFLRITQLPAEPPLNALPTVRWERRKKPANAPNPPRAGATMVYHKQRGIAFGGVHDVEESEEGIESEFFDTLHAWNIDRNRFFPLTLRKPRGGPGKQVVQGNERGGGGGARRGRGKADEEELLRNLAALETGGRIEDSDAMKIDRPQDAQEADQGQEQKPEQLILQSMPHARFNAQLAVQNDVLYIYGGTYESGDREYTFDEMYSLDLGRLDGVRQVFHRELENWVGSDDDDSDSDSDDEYPDSDSDMDDAPGSEAGSSHKRASSTPGTALSPALPTPLAADEEPEPESEPASSLASDSRPYPRPFETLRDFFTRTTVAWQDLVLEELKYPGAEAHDSVKGLRKRAFEMGEARWWDCREEVMRLEDEQEEAGIGEVVSLGERGEGGGSGGGGVGKRR